MTRHRLAIGLIITTALVLVWLLAPPSWDARSSPSSWETVEATPSSTAARELGAAGTSESSRAATDTSLLIRGRVVLGSPDGPPASDARLALLEPATSEEHEEAPVLATTESNSKGEFELPYPRAGDYDVFCELPDWRALVRTTLPTRDLLVVLHPRWASTSLSGRVVGPGDEPVTEFSVTVRGRGVRDRAPERLLANDGQFRVQLAQSSPTADLELRIDAPGFRRLGLDVRAQSGGDHDVGTVRLQPFEQEVRGVVVDADSGVPVQSALVTPVSTIRSESGLESWGHESSLETDEGGRFQIDSIRGEGVVGLQVSAAGYAPRLVLWDQVDTTHGEAVIALGGGARLHGRVLDSSGRALPGVTVRLTSDTLENPARVFHPLWQEFSETDESGSFSFDRLGDGEYSVSLLRQYCGGDGTAASRIRSVRHLGDEESYVEFHSMAPGSVTIPVDWTGAEATTPSVQGRLKDGSGRTVASSICWAPNCALEFPEVAPGNYEVTVFADASRGPGLRLSVFVGTGEVTLSPIEARDL